MFDCVPILLVLVLTEKYDTMQDSYGASSVSKTATGKIIFFFLNMELGAVLAW